MRKPARVWALAALAALATGAVPAARADWIVTRDGGKFETKGSWQVKGKMVVFTLPNGTLSSLRGDKVDLEASQRATEQAKKAAAEGPAAAISEREREQAARPKKQPVWVLTDKDFKKSPAEPAAAAAAADTAADKAKGDKEPPAKDTVPAPAGSLQVLGWDRVNATDPAAAGGVELTGTVKNTTSDQLTQLMLTASFYDPSGTLVAKVPAALAASHLAPGEITSFTVTAPGVFGFAAVKFEPQGRGFTTHPRPPAAGDAAAKPADASAGQPPPESAKPATPPPG